MTEYGEQLANMMRRLETAESALAALRRGVFGELPPGIGSVEDRLAAIERTQVGALAAMGDPVVVHSGASAVDANELPIVESAIPVKVTMDGGVGGSASTDCSYTYSVDDKYGYKIAEDMTPEAPRIPKTQYAAGDGWGWGCGEGDDFILLDAGEKEVAEVIT
jgi:hypothetical protein